ncbi:MAG TPA: DMT family transporter [Chlamydiales bacterium]|nr:DMT family transporter [Chlamydiales bacterium]
MTTTSGRTIQNRTVLGVVLMLIGLALYPLSDAFVKHLMGTYTVYQTSFLRSFTRLLPLLVAVFMQGGVKKILGTSCYKLHAIRLSVNLAYTLLFMFSYTIASLTTVYTLSYTSPLFMILLSAILLKESVGKEKWFAVFAGLVGVIIAMRPGSGVFEMAAFVVLFATFLGALNKILMRKLAATEHSLALAVYPNIVMVLAMAPILLFQWQPMPWEHWLLFGIVGIITAAGQYAIAQALRFAQGSTLAPIDYSSYFWVIALDFFWWQKAPDLYTICGAVVIVGSNLYILYRTRREQALAKGIA